MGQPVVPCQRRRAAGRGCRRYSAPICRGRGGDRRLARGAGRGSACPGMAGRSGGRAGCGRARQVPGCCGAAVRRGRRATDATGRWEARDGPSTVRRTRPAAGAGPGSRAGHDAQAGRAGQCRPCPARGGERAAGRTARLAPMTWASAVERDDRVIQIGPVQAALPADLGSCMRRHGPKTSATSTVSRRSGRPAPTGLARRARCCLPPGWKEGWQASTA